MRVEKSKRKIATGFKRVVLVCIAIYVVYVLVQQQIQLNSYNAQKNYYKAKIEQEKKTLENLENNKLLFTTDSYIEKVAREKLGLVKPGEVIFIDINN